MQRHGGVLLTGFLSLLSYRTWDHQPRSGPTHNGLAPPTMGWASPWITSEEKAFQACLQLNLMEALPH